MLVWLSEDQHQCSLSLWFI